jgi:hypothetical protein
VERRDRQDRDVLASLSRAIRNPRGTMRADLCQLADFIKRIIKETK